MTERGIVKEIQGKLVTVQLEMTAACGACGNNGCKTSRNCLQAYNRDEVTIAEGDEVEIQVEGKAQLEGALWVLGLPLALFAGGYVAGRALFPGASEAPAALSGLAGLVIGVVVGVLVQKGKRLETLPRILRVVHAEAGGPAEVDEGGGEI
ncbi:MAG: SoxR reducing system RseC family protein [Spirochaetaceae bacterium]|nr:SoxR reducing system RseC family protein [Spirochaetaceae bacterium]